MDAVRRAVRLSVVAVVILAAPGLTTAQQAPAPAGATALCRDGTYSFSKHHSGTCSHHGGVAMWFGAVTARPPTASDTLGEAPRRELPACGAHCGTERWAVKTLSDPDRKRVQPQPVDASIE